MNNKQLENFKKLCKSYYHLKTIKEENDAKFEIEKNKFYSKMSDFWKNNKIKEKSFKDDIFSVTKKQSIKILWDIEKLEKKLTKEQLKKCIVKKYEINNINGLLKFLKSCGISKENINKFILPYFTITKEVNQKVMDKMYDLGEVTKEQTEGCYTVEIKEPFYQLKVVEDKQNEGEQKGD